MNKNQSGFSLLEIMIGVGLSVGVAAAGFTLMNWMGGETKDSYVKQNRGADLSVLKTHLLRHLPSGNVRAFAFTGRSLADPAPDRSLARFLLPVPNACADLSSCAGNSAFLYVSDDKQMSAALSAICAVDPNTWLIDYGDRVYGTTSFANGKFLVDAPGASIGEVETGTDRVMGLFNPPNISLWRSIAPATMANVYKDPSDRWTIDFPGPTALPPPCLNGLRKDGAGEPIVNALALLPVAPATITQFTGGDPNISATEKTNAQGSFPLRVKPLRLRSIGMSLEAGKKMAVLKECSYAGLNLTCGGPALFTYGPIETISLQEGFSVPLRGISRKQFYEIGPATASASCPVADCLPLPIGNPAAIPVLSGSNETFENLNGGAFSYLKQEALSGIRFRITHAEGSDVDILLPVR